MEAQANNQVFVIIKKYSGEYIITQLPYNNLEVGDHVYWRGMDISSGLDMLEDLEDLEDG